MKGSHGSAPGFKTGVSDSEGWPGDEQPVAPFVSNAARTRWLTVSLIAQVFFGAWLDMVGDEIVLGIHPRVLRISGLMPTLVLCAMVVFLILFGKWIHRAYRNLPALGAREPRLSPEWAVGSFFVPFLNLFRPYQVISEIWKASDPDLNETDRSSRRRATTPPWIVAWWAAWLAYWVTYLRESAAELLKRHWDMFPWADLLDRLTGVAASALTILVVRRIDARQEEKHRRLGDRAQPPVVAGGPAPSQSAPT